MTNIIFFGNGPLADTTKTLLEQHPDFQIIFHAKTKQDLEEVKKIKEEIEENELDIIKFRKEVEKQKDSPQ